MISYNFCSFKFSGVYIKDIPTIGGKSRMLWPGTKFKKKIDVGIEAERKSIWTVQIPSKLENIFTF